MIDKELLIQEVEELTDLLQNDEDWRDLHDLILAKGLDIQNILLAGFHEDEDENEYGVIVTPTFKDI
jgi:hypothetical protein